MKRKPEAAENTESILWHAIEEEEVMSKLDSSIKGLAEEAAAERMKKHGPNKLAEKTPPSIMKIFLMQFVNPLIYVLLAAAVLSAVIGDIKDAAFIFIVLMINSIIGTVQEHKAEQSALALQRLLKINTLVMRSGEKRTVSAEEIVPGDIVFLESGNKVPADLRLLESNSLSIDESFLTGESVAVVKKSGKIDEKAGVGDRINIAYAGATVTSGRGIGIAVSTGKQTEVGKVAENVTMSSGSKSPLVIRMEKFSTQISYIVLVACAIIGAILVSRGEPLFQVFFVAVALAVAAIPEGLPVALTVALSVATSRMAKRHVIVRKIAAVESLGSCTVIASDKTGTLTVNQQTLKQLYIPGTGYVSVGGEGYNFEGKITHENGEALSNEHLLAAKIAALCNEGVLKNREGRWISSGDAVDVALLAFAGKAGLHPGELKDKCEILAEIPYESEHKHSAVFYMEGDRPVAAAKGAVETVLSFCGSSTDAKLIEKEALAMAKRGYRVLALAYGETNTVELGKKKLSNMEIKALAGFIDPLRPGVKESVEKCRGAGVDVLMVTGDHPATALAIARELGIAKTMEEVQTGAALEEKGDPESEAFTEVVSRTKVFARVSPLQKLHIVAALIKLGHFVAVTGDGVNDAPALKKANIGVAMGSGTDVAKDTGAMIVTDDNFASIVGGIEEGRFAYDNIRKVIYLLISTGVAELIMFLLAVGTGMKIPLLAVQLLWLNLVTNGIQGAALAFEKGEKGAMQRPARNPKEGVFNKLMIQEVAISGLVMAVLSFGMWYYLMEVLKWENEAQARNVVLLLMVLLVNMHVFNCRSEYDSAFKVPLSNNWFLIFGVIAAQGLHIICMYIPLMQQVLVVEPVTFYRWLEVLGLSLILLAVMEIFKVVRKR